MLYLFVLFVQMAFQKAIQMSMCTSFEEANEYNTTEIC